MVPISTLFIPKRLQLHNFAYFSTSTWHLANVKLSWMGHGFRKDSNLLQTNYTFRLNRIKWIYSIIQLYRISQIFLQLEDRWYKQDPKLSKVFSLKESQSISNQHTPIYISLPYCVLSSPAVTLLSVLQCFRAAHPYRNDLLRDLKTLSAMPQLFGEGLHHFVWNNKVWWQSVVPTVPLLQALIASAYRTFTPRWKRQ